MPEKKEEMEIKSDAWLMIKELGRQNKRIFTALVIVLCLWFATIGGFVWYLSLYDFSAKIYDVTQDTSDGGDANYIGNDGDIINGSPEGTGN